MTDQSSPIILAFSGGLDTSFCVPWLQETYGRQVITATVDTGGIDDSAAAALHDRAIKLGASEHVLLDCKKEFFDSVLRHLIAGNVRRGQFYPLCVGAERGLQASRLAALANERGATTVAHGCTAAGNDQVRFEVALRTLNPALEILAPVRDNDWARDDQIAYLEKHQLPLPAQGSAYSVNRGLWGVTIGGQETLTSERSLPEEAWVLSAGAYSEPKSESQHTLEFENGIPVRLDAEKLDPVALVEKLEVLAGPYAIGRGVHLGDTVLGTKGRVAFEAPAAVTLITAHRELEKLVLSAQQSRVKESVASVYGPSSIKKKRSRRTRVQMDELRHSILEIAARYAPLSLRQLFYRMVAVAIILKTEAEYKAVGRQCGYLREAGELSWDWIVDNTRWMRKPASYASLSHLLHEQTEL